MNYRCFWMKPKQCVSQKHIMKTQLTFRASQQEQNMGYQSKQVEQINNQDKTINNKIQYLIISILIQFAFTAIISFQVSLILELCPLGNLRSFLERHKGNFITCSDHEFELSSRKKNYDTAKHGYHSLFLWSYQVSSKNYVGLKSD